MRIYNFKKNYKSILGVTFLAFLLWFMVKLNRTYEYIKDVPIHYTNLDTNLVFKYPQDNKIKVQFAGRGRDLLRLPFFNLSYQVDLSDTPSILEFDPAEYSEYLSYPRDLNIAIKSIINPKKIIVDLDRKMKTKIPVEFEMENYVKPMTGYLLVDVALNPDSILVIGPSEMFRKVNTISIEEKKFIDISQSFEENFKINIVSEYNAYYSPSMVKIRFDIQRLLEDFIIDIPVTVINVPPNHQVVPLPSETTVYYRGPEKILAELTKDDFRVEIDYENVLRQGVKKVKANLYTEANVTITKTDPEEFEWIIHRGRVD
jgi:hypothetical protein